MVMSRYKSSRFRPVEAKRTIYRVTKINKPACKARNPGPIVHTILLFEAQQEISGKSVSVDYKGPYSEANSVVILGEAGRNGVGGWLLNGSESRAGRAGGCSGSEGGAGHRN